MQKLISQSHEFVFHDRADYPVDVNGRVVLFQLCQKLVIPFIGHIDAKTNLSTPTRASTGRRTWNLPADNADDQGPGYRKKSQGAFPKRYI